METIIIKFGADRLPNDSHMQFQHDFVRLVQEVDPEAIGIKALWQDTYMPSYGREKEALDLVRANVSTTVVNEDEAYRDHVVRGFFGIVKAHVAHYNPDKQAAAERIRIVLKTFAGLPDKGDDDQTAATIDMLAELRRPAILADINLIGLDDWLPVIEESNNNFVKHKEQFYVETSAKTPLRMKSVRVETDNAYHAVVARIEALVNIEGIEKYENFVKALNTLIEHYKNIIKQRRGMRQAKKE